ncbi:MAG TPA: YceI family protein [Acidimicrobiales bacterium]|jgi:polyisoprenoid-binding protein YceI
MSRKLMITGGVVVLVLATIGAGAFFLFLRDDAPPPAALRTRSGDPSSVGSTVSVDGTWAVQPGDQVFAGYRMQEKFGGDTVEHTAVGRTPKVSGTMTIDSGMVTTASFSADLTALSSDQVRRDRIIKTDGLETNRFPTATFVLSDPIPLDTPSTGTVVNTNATGDLTLHGVTKRVTIPIMARWNGDTIDISGGTGIVLADYQMSPPGVGGFVSVADHGSFELQLTFVKQ